jgi:hypothetical protein
MVNGVEVSTYAEAVQLSEATGAKIIPKYTTIDEKPIVDLALVARRMAVIRRKLGTRKAFPQKER